jgi:hypothetical protein
MLPRGYAAESPAWEKPQSLAAKKPRNAPGAKTAR